MHPVGCGAVHRSWSSGVRATVRWSTVVAAAVAAVIATTVAAVEAASTAAVKTSASTTVASAVLGQRGRGCAKESCGSNS